MTTEARGPFSGLRRRIDQATIRTEGSPPPTQPALSQPPATVGGGHGIVAGAKRQIPDVNAQPAHGRPLSQKDAERLMWAEMLAASRELVESSTVLTAALGRTGAYNGVIEVALWQIPATGDIYLMREFSTVIGMVRVTNHHAADPLIIQAGMPMGPTGPTSGIGVQRCAAGATVAMPIGTRQVTVWGTAATLFSFQAFTGLQGFGGNL
ncbi:MAG TPA: hypothetical protein VK659_08405 [Asanoa sp.]|nr:hypothetical protein [Asanoa sp.]